MTREESAQIKALELLLSDMGFVIDGISLLLDRISVTARRGKDVGETTISSWIMSTLTPRAAAAGWALQSWDASREALSVLLERPRTQGASKP